MADDLKNRGPADAARINIHEDWELRYWSEKFGISIERLLEAVKSVGFSAEAVKAFLQK